MKEANDFREECDALAALLDGRDAATLSTVTQFKGWTIEDVIAHLHVWNVAALMTLESREKFQAFFAFVMQCMGAGDGHPEMQRAWLDQFAGGLKGAALLAEWRNFYPKLADAYGRADPETRVAWAGPDMSVAAKMVARQMECWAHGQEIFDVLGAERNDGDRLRNIADLGVRTYSWTFRNRGTEPPAPKPHVRLTAPSGAIWEWNDPQADNYVAGDASAFCQVVTQTRNIADTDLEVVGDNATAWMAIAQCFAGAPETPPEKGARFKAN